MWSYIKSVLAPKEVRDSVASLPKIEVTEPKLQKRRLVNELSMRGIEITGSQLDAKVRLFNNFEMPITSRYDKLLSDESHLNAFILFNNWK